MLRGVELHGSFFPMCFSCAGQAMVLDPMPPTIAALKQQLTRERRGVDRRIGRPDTRVFQYERRAGQRRAGREDGEQIEDDMIIEIFVQDDVGVAATIVAPVGPFGLHDELEGQDGEDLTRIRELMVL